MGIDHVLRGINDRQMRVPGRQIGMVYNVMTTHTRTYSGNLRSLQSFGTWGRRHLHAVINNTWHQNSSSLPSSPSLVYLTGPLPAFPPPRMQGYPNSCSIRALLSSDKRNPPKNDVARISHLAGLLRSLVPPRTLPEFRSRQPLPQPLSHRSA